METMYGKDADRRQMIRNAFIMAGALGQD